MKIKAETKITHCEKRLQFHLISWRGNFAERHSFRARNYAETVPFRKNSTPGNQVKYGIFRSEY